jgi:putative membrane protein
VRAPLRLAARDLARLRRAHGLSPLRELHPGAGQRQRAGQSDPTPHLPPPGSCAREDTLPRRGPLRAPGGVAIPDPTVARRFGENPFLKALLAAYLTVWIATAIAPADRGDWLLENLLVFAAGALLLATHRVFVFSNFSYLLIAIFLALHAVGAHYTYSLTPFGDWLATTFGLPRNPYDRLVHFAFGLLLAYPLHEVARRGLHLHGASSWAFPAIALLALSSGYEIVESWAARIVDPALGQAFLGTQGDEWDSQKDMTLAFSGAAIALSASALYRARSGREPWLWLRGRGSRDQ